MLSVPVFQPLPLHVCDGVHIARDHAKMAGHSQHIRPTDAGEAFSIIVVGFAPPHSDVVSP